MLREGHPASKGDLGSLSVLGQVRLPGANPGVKLGAQAGCPGPRLARTEESIHLAGDSSPAPPWGRILPTALGAEGRGRLGSHSVPPGGI